MKTILKKFIIEALLFEGEQLNDSLDSQVDDLLASYEREAGVQNESLINAKFLSEAEGDEEEKKDADPAPPKKSINDLDVEAFASSVARLIDNADNLLETRSTISRRAENFLAKTYDEATKKAFKRVMSERHGIVAGKTEREVDNDNSPAPPADRAGPGGAG